MTTATITLMMDHAPHATLDIQLETEFVLQSTLSVKLLMKMEAVLHVILRISFMKETAFLSQNWPTFSYITPNVVHKNYSN